MRKWSTVTTSCFYVLQNAFYNGEIIVNDEIIALQLFHFITLRLLPSALRRIIVPV